MDSVSEELSHEQKYFDIAWDHRERKRATLGESAGAAANSGAAMRIRKETEERLARLGAADDAVAFGRMDDEDGERFYLGYHTITDDKKDVLVINWQAPIAARYFASSHADPLGLRMKRAFECDLNEILSFSDTVFAQLAADVAQLERQDEINDALLSDLESNRTGTMRDIVRTIQAAQFELIRAPLDQLTIIQGGPGTGKTAIALHRVSWMIFNQEQIKAEDILVVGPNPTFTRYTRSVLPSLGDRNVQQLDIDQLHPPVRRGRTEDPEVRRLKGDRRIAGLVERGLYARIGVPEPQVQIQLRGRSYTVTGQEVAPLLAQSRASGGTYAGRRQFFRELLTELFYQQVPVDRQQIRSALEPIMDRLWPSVTAAAFLREFYGSRDRLIAAAGDEFTAREVSQLHRRAAERLSEESWTDADLAVLDEADHLINGVQARYLHIVVDEVQDLSPMQLRTVARRSTNGSMTIVGDVAQSTGPWARDDWNELLDDLPDALAPVLEELRYGYRVPRQVFELAAQLLPIAAPQATAPQVVRDGPAEPGIHQLNDRDDRAGAAVRLAMEHASHGRSVAIISPASCRAEVERTLDARDVSWRSAAASGLAPGINLVSPQEAKGLEFDAVIVVEPEEIVAEDSRGHRLLYVALTRTTRYLDIVCVGHPLGFNPTAGGPPIGSAAEDPATEPPDKRGAVTPGAQDLDPAPEEGPVVVELNPEEAAEFLEALEIIGWAPDPDESPSEVTRPSDDRDRAGTSSGGLTSSAARRHQHIIEAAARKIAAELREALNSNLWGPVLTRATEIINSEGARDKGANGSVSG